MAAAVTMATVTAMTMAATTISVAVAVIAARSVKICLVAEAIAMFRRSG
jgi:hypothetical protein